MELDEVHAIAVLGAGNMGHGIAEIAALAGFDVTLRDISEELVQNGYDQIEWSLGKLVEQGRVAEDDADAALDRIEPVVAVADAVRDADVVIEAVPERMDVKREVYAEVEAAAPDRAVFATNTSSLSITELSEATDRPERFCGMHFFNPPVRMPLVEVIAGDHTAEATLELIEALAEALDKTPVRVRNDSPGFIVNRVLVPLLNEAAWIVASNDADIAAVDATTKYDMGLPMGAFELSDQVGIDVSLDVLDYLHETLGDAYEPCPLLREKVDAGDVGTKAGRGFYDHEDGGVQIPADAGREDLERRLVAVMANEVAKLVAGGVAEPAEIDEAMRLGAGFPDGPAKLADGVGLDAIRRELDDHHERTGAARYEPAELLIERAEAGRGFYADESGGEGEPAFEALRVERDGRVGRIVLDRPHRLNTITPETLDELAAAIDQFEADDGVRAVLVTGAGDRAFSAGADVTAFDTDNPVDAVELSRAGQRTFGRLEASALPVVAGVDGYCLGGGMELATCCDLRIASPGSTFGQTEHNLGVMPGWGGTQRLRHVVGEGRAREIILTANRYDAETMAGYGFVNEVVDDAEARALEVARDLAAGPPVAQRLTKRAMLAGREDAAAGLEIEAEAFGLLMTTDDLLEGIAAFAEDRDPEFEGA